MRNGDNGFNFNPLDETSIIKAFLRIIDLDDETLCRMGEESFNLGRSYVMTDWVNRALEIAY